MIPPLPDFIYRNIIEAALAEDMGRAGDLTGLATLGPDARLSVSLRAREGGVLSGLRAAELAILSLDPDAGITVNAKDGDGLEPGMSVLDVTANARALLAAERTALNLVGLMSGVATLTRAYVDAVQGTGARITDTRKTIPSLRAIQKYAVRCGGGISHRMALDDAILIKDNHIAAVGSVAQAIRSARRMGGHLTPVEVEVDTLEQFDEAMAERPDVIMLDNFTLDQLREAVQRNAGRIRLEASGGVTLNTVAEIARTGVDVISVGALTHSARWLDFGLDAA